MCSMEEHKCLALIILELASPLEHHQSQDQLFPHFVTQLNKIVYNFCLYAHLKTRMKQKDWMHVNKRKKIVLDKDHLLNGCLRISEGLWPNTSLSLCCQHSFERSIQHQLMHLWPILGGGRKVDFKWTLPSYQNH